MTLIQRDIQPPVHNLLGELPCLENLPSNFRFLTPNIVTLPNGIPLYIIQTGNYDFSQIEVGFQAGKWSADKPLQAGLTNQMLLKGCHGKSEEEISEFIDNKGAYIIPSYDNDFASVSLYSINRHLAELMPLLAEILLYPDFQENALEVELQKSKQKHQIDLKKVDVVARLEMNKMIFGDAHPYGKYPLISDFDNINQSDLNSFFDSNYHHKISYILASGNINQDVINLITQYLGNSDFNYSEITIEKPIKSENQLPDFRYISKQDACQTAIRFGKKAPTLLHPDYAGIKVLNTLLGGYFGSRLMTNIREDKGYTYGIGSAYLSMLREGIHIIATEVNSNNTQEAIHEIKNELNALCMHSVGKDELYTVKNFMAGEFYRSIDGPSGLANRVRQTIRFGLAPDFYLKYLQKIFHISPEDIQVLAMLHLNPDNFHSIAVGKH